MSKHSDAVEAVELLKRYTDNRDCKKCTFYFNEACILDDTFGCPSKLTSDDITYMNAVRHYLEQEELEQGEEQWT